MTSNRPRRVQPGVPTGGQFAASVRPESDVALVAADLEDSRSTGSDAAHVETVTRAFEQKMGCGPGEIHTQTACGPDGLPYEEPIAQTCRSAAHAYAYWNGSCQFAEEMAATATAVPHPASAVLQAATAVHETYFNTTVGPGDPGAGPEPEDVWRFDREFRAAVGGGVLPDSALGRLREAEDRLRHLLDYFERAERTPRFTGNYGADVAAAHAWHEAAEHSHWVLANGVPDEPEPRPPSNDPPF